MVHNRNNIFSINKLIVKNFTVGIFATLLILLSGCKKPFEDLDENLVFRYNESSNITSLDPAFSKVQSNIWACNQIFNGLVQLDDSLNVKPDLAKSWIISPDGKTYDFIIRRDIKFQKDSSLGKDSTRNVTARDFEYSFNRLRDPQVASPGNWILQNVETFKATNDSVFSITLSKPFPQFLGLLAMKYASVVPKEAVDFYGSDFRSHPVGTGPFAFKLWKENVKLVLRKNPLYFEKDSAGKSLPNLEAVAVTFLPDKQSGFLQFIQGKLDFMSGLDPSYKDEMLTQRGDLQPKYRDQINLITGPYLNTEYLGFRMDFGDATINDVKIRKAMNYGFDRKKLVLYLRNNMGIAATSGMIPAGLPGFTGFQGYDYDPEKAKDLIKDYISKTKKTPKLTLSTNASYIDIAEFLQREWQKVGIDVQVDVSPPATLRTAISTGKVSMFRASWIADYPDAENYLSLFYSGNFSPNGPNYTHYKNAAFDQLYDQAFRETDAEKRTALYSKMDKMVIDDAPVIPLFYDKAARFTQKNVSGLGINALNMLDLRKVRKN